MNEMEKQLEGAQFNVKRVLAKFFSISGMGVVVAYVILCIFLSFQTRNFLTINNFLTIFRQAVWIGIMGIGMTFVIATGGIDLSVGAILGFSGLAIAVFLTKGMNVFLAIVSTLGIGIFIGLVNGFLIAKVGLPAFIATLGTMSILRGAIYVYTKGIPIFGLNSFVFRFLAQGYIGFIPFPIILMMLFLAIFSFILYRTKFGRHVLAIGSNEEGARLVGIRIDRIKMQVYVISGFLCSVAGILFASRSEAATATAGTGYELDVIASVVIGGTSMSGGKANLPATFLGAVLMATIRNGLNMMGINSLWNNIVLGVVIILAVIMDIGTNKLKETT